MVIHARVQAVLPILRHGIGCQSHDRNTSSIAGFFNFANSDGGLETIELRHVAIHQDHVKAGVLVVCQRFIAIVGHHHIIAIEAFQHTQSDRLVHQVVFNQQDFPPATGHWFIHNFSHRASDFNSMGLVFGHDPNQTFVQLRLADRFDQARVDTHIARSFDRCTVANRRQHHQAQLAQFWH